MGGSSGKRDGAIAQRAFCNGARGVLKVLAPPIDRSDYEGLHATISPTGRHIERIQARRPRARRH